MAENIRIYYRVEYWYDCLLCQRSHIECEPLFHEHMRRVSEDGMGQTPHAHDLLTGAVIHTPVDNSARQA